MKRILFISFTIPSFLLGCFPKLPPQAYRTKDAPYHYIEADIENLPNYEIKIWSYKIVTTANKPSSDTDVIRPGILFSALSYIHYKYQVTKRMCNESDTVSISFEQNEKYRRDGKSFATSVENVVKAVQLKETNPQPEPRTYPLYREVTGSLYQSGDTSSFFYYHDYRANKFDKIYSGWLAINGDTLRSNSFIDVDHNYRFWYELLKADTVVAVIDMYEAAPGKIYLHRSLTKNEKLLCLAYFATICKL